MYSATKLDEAVCRIARLYFASMQTTVESVWQEQARRQLRSSVDKRLKSLQTQMESLNQDEKTLRDEVLRALKGESIYKPEMLKEMLDEKKVKRDSLEAEYLACQAEKATENAQIQYLSEQFSHIKEWAQEFDNATTEQKKMILARLIQKITVAKDYHLTVTFYVTQEDFMNAVEPAEVSIRQACEEKSVNR